MRPGHLRVVRPHAVQPMRRTPVAADRTIMRRPRLTATALPVAARWLGQFATSSVIWLIMLSVVPIAWGWQPRAIISGSMEPRIHVGDVVVIAPGTPKDLTAGQVISFTDPNQPSRVLTHRLVQKYPDGTWQTKGDANPTPDTSPIRESAIVGKPRILVPWVGMLSYWMTAGHPEYAVGAAALVVVLIWLGLASGPPPTQPAHEPPGRARQRRPPHTPRHRRTLKMRIRDRFG